MLELKHIKKYYAMESGIVVKALDDVSLTVNDGEFVSIIGPSGSGKSTLMNVIGCLDIATEGEYYVDSVEISKFKENDLAKLRNVKIGFIFQGFNLLPKLSAIENVELPLIYQGIKKQERRERAIDALEKVGMGERLNHKPTQLSGGQQQRVAIARAIATRPTVILADEPTGNLDSKSGKEVMEILLKLHDNGTTIVLITHDDGIAHYAQRVVKILDGKIFSEVQGEKSKRKQMDKKEPTESINDESDGKKPAGTEGFEVVETADAKAELIEKSAAKTAKTLKADKSAAAKADKSAAAKTKKPAAKVAKVAKSASKPAKPAAKKNTIKGDK